MDEGAMGVLVVCVWMCERRVDVVRRVRGAEHGCVVCGNVMSGAGVVLSDGERGGDVEGDGDDDGGTGKRCGEREGGLKHVCTVAQLRQARGRQPTQASSSSQQHTPDKLPT